MPVRPTDFRPDVAVESLLYLASKLSKPTVHELLKLRYFADKIHLSRFGSLASGDAYAAMKFGPVALNTYDLLKAASGEQSQWIHPGLVDAVSGVLVVKPDGMTVQAKRGADLRKLAKSDIECLDEAVATYGHLDFAQRTEVSHDAAWKAAFDTAAEEKVGRSVMPLRSIVETLQNADEVLEHIYG